MVVAPEKKTPLKTVYPGPKKTGTTSSPGKPYVPYTGERIKLRSATSNVCKLISSLHSEQMREIINICFGPI